VDELYVIARRVLLDALDALGKHRAATILVGAQAIYLHTGDADLGVERFIPPQARQHLVHFMKCIETIQETVASPSSTRRAQRRAGTVPGCIKTSTCHDAPSFDHCPYAVSGPGCQ